MLRELLKFEWHYFSRKPLLYSTVAVFFVLGLMLGLSKSAGFPNIHYNSPYQISYLLGILSLGSIFSLTLLTGESILRERESGLDQIIYATPVPKYSYLLARLLALAGIGLFSFAAALPGLAFGFMFNEMPADKFGTGALLHYLWPYLVLVLPNVFLCTAILCSTAWLSSNKLVIYVSGLFIYVLYIAASIFSNSPLIAGSAPVEPEKVSLFARLDPFGLAAFFEQTRYWSAAERNIRLLGLEGDLLVNRLIWISFSILILVVSYRRFDFREGRSSAGKKVQPPQDVISRMGRAIVVSPVPGNFRHHFLAFRSFFRIHLVSVLKGLPFLLILLIWTCLLAIEIKNAADGDSRLGIQFVSTGLMVSTIMEVMPVFALLVILFYSSELLWKSKASRFSMIEESTAVNPLAAFWAKFAALLMIALTLLIWACLAGMLAQAASGTVPEFGLYASLFYLLGLPLAVSAFIALAVQTLINSRYIGLALATVLLLLCSSRLGQLAGISNPLFRFAEPFSIPYADMNGFTGYLAAFRVKTLYSAAFAGSFIPVIWYFSYRKRLSAPLLILPVLAFLASGTYIYHQTYLLDPVLSGSALNDWKQAYEHKLYASKQLEQPTIVGVQAEIDLFPKEQRYQVRGMYRLQNKSGLALDTLLISVHRETRLQNLKIRREGRLVKDVPLGYYFYILDHPLQPGAFMSMNFSFSSGWSGFKGHSAFNSIIGNGSFIRISNYFPDLGYDENNELTNSLERTIRGMKPQDELPALESRNDEPFNQRFINLQATISTDGDQLAVGQGVLQKQWREGGRNYFCYQTDRPVPFRFAVSSARYQVQKERFRNTMIEIYYHPSHAENVGRLIGQAKQTLMYCEQNFGPYPHPLIRFAEVSAFAEGFGATAYPTTIYMKENGGFHSKPASQPGTDVILQLAGHEMSHEWWGSAQMSPEIKEGGWVMTETLAKYTELMLLRRAQGAAAQRTQVAEHLDAYSSLRSFFAETPLYKTTYQTPHLPYDKGTVVMYQLYLLIGEKAINQALHNLLQHFSFPNRPPDTEDLLAELYRLSPSGVHPKIDELFKQIITYDLKMGEAEAVKTGKGYQVKFAASARKYTENGRGIRKAIRMNGEIEVCVETASGKRILRKFKPDAGRLKGSISVNEMPVKVVLDPYVKLMDVFRADNEITPSGFR